MCGFCAVTQTNVQCGGTRRCGLTMLTITTTTTDASISVLRLTNRTLPTRMGHRSSLRIPTYEVNGTQQQHSVVNTEPPLPTLPSGKQTLCSFANSRQDIKYSESRLWKPLCGADVIYDLSVKTPLNQSRKKRRHTVLVRLCSEPVRLKKLGCTFKFKKAPLTGGYLRRQTQVK